MLTKCSLKILPLKCLSSENCAEMLCPPYMITTTVEIIWYISYGNTTSFRVLLNLRALKEFTKHCFRG